MVIHTTCGWVSTSWTRFCTSPSISCSTTSLWGNFPGHGGGADFAINAAFSNPWAAESCLILLLARGWVLEVPRWGLSGCLGFSSSGVWEELCTSTNPGVSASPGCAVEGEGMATVAELEAKLTSGEAGKLPEAGQWVRGPKDPRCSGFWNLILLSTQKWGKQFLKICTAQGSD